MESPMTFDDWALLLPRENDDWREHDRRDVTRSIVRNAAIDHGIPQSVAADRLMLAYRDGLDSSDDVFSVLEAILLHKYQLPFVQRTNLPF
jgi:hypothetical protein